LFAILRYCEVKSYATERCSTPPGPEGSNGRHTVLCDVGKLGLFFYLRRTKVRGTFTPTLQTQGLDRRPFTDHVNNRRLIHMLQLFYLIRFFAASLLSHRDMHAPPLRQARHRRSVAHVRPLPFLPRLFLLHQGASFLRLSSEHACARRPRLRWPVHLHEKRYYYQLHGERTPYRHS
jgi:hypothetical protein